MILHNLNNEDLKSNEEVIKELQEMGVQVIYKPMALVPDTLESSILLGEKSFGLIEMDIHDALRKIRIRKSVIGDPFS
jgi:hypothetical protein